MVTASAGVSVRAASGVATIETAELGVACIIRARVAVITVKQLGWTTEAICTVTDGCAHIVVVAAKTVGIALATIFNQAFFAF